MNAELVVDAGRRLEVIVTTVSSDAHTWNLVYLQLLLEELGCRVTNLGACTPDETILRECRLRRPTCSSSAASTGTAGRRGCG
ncbi:hypothetical protein [Dactylosporangium darangshiense]|uniref:hypothetical protein n=1 Tax=Dactylosporangium darangshiense TaxID=579108 RepID=UPI00362FEB2D